jgi:bla regulator protein BlaR1
MEYLFKTSAVIAIFYLSYKLFLERDTFFESNRWFLLLGLVTAFILPFMVIPIYVESTSIDLSNYVFNTQVDSQNAVKPFDVMTYLPVVYGLGVAFFSIRFIIQFISLAFVIIKNKSEIKGKFQYIKTTHNVSPFSFFNWIVYNPIQFSETELDQIITHEKVHVTDRHSFDILLTQISCIVLWFNPFIWFYNKDLKQNLEFIADQETANKTECKKSYQYTLLKTSVPTHQMALSNNFYNSLIKKRIVMLHKSKSKKINQIKYALVIPLLALFLMSFNTEKIYVTKNKSPLTEELLKNEVIEVIITKDFKDKDFENLKAKLKSEGYSATFKKVKRNTKDEIIAIKIEVTSKSANAHFNIDGDEPIEPVKITIEDNGKNISIGNGNFKKGKHMVFVTEDGDKHKKDPLGSEKNVFVIKTGDNDDEFTAEEIIIKNGDTMHLVKSNNAHDVLIDSDDDIIFIKKDSKDKKIHKIVKIKTNGKEDGINWISDNDKNVIVNGKNDTKVKIISSDAEAPIMMLNGKEISHEEMEKIDPNTIDNIDVIKGDAAIKKYGNKGKNGIILISSKNENSSKYTLKMSGEALYKVDGKEVRKDVVDTLNPDDIESVNVLKGDAAIKKYGEKAKNGVIEITTKKKN